MSILAERQDTVAVAHPFAPSRTSSRESMPAVEPNHHSSRGSGSGTIAGRENRSKDRSMFSTIAPTSWNEDSNGNNTKNSVKLRNSCRSCAVSKVRCNKAKPTCSRCEARGIECHYLQSKRPGRVPGSSVRRLRPNQLSGQPETITAFVSQVDSIPDRGTASSLFLSSPTFGHRDCITGGDQQRSDSASSISSAGTLDANYTATPSGGEFDMNVSYIPNAPVAPMGPLIVSPKMEDIVYSSLMDCSTSLEDLNSWWFLNDEGSGLADRIADFTNETSSPPTSSHLSISVSTEPSSLSISSLSSTVHLNALVETTASSRASGQPRHQSPPPMLQDLAAPGRAESSTTKACNCMKQALEQLNHLSSGEIPQVSPSSPESYTQRVLTENKQDIDANLAMLACRACSKDKFLLMILLMITAKILTRYVSAVASWGACNPTSASSEIPNAMYQEEQATLASDHADWLMEMSRAWGGFCMMLPARHAGDDAKASCREAVQRMLRELHRVQRLIAQLSIRRKSLDEREASMSFAAGLADMPTTQLGPDGSGSLIGSTHAPPYDSMTGATPTTPFSSNALEMVEADVRRGLSALSAVIRGLLSNS